MVGSGSTSYGMILGRRGVVGIPEHVRRTFTTGETHGLEQEADFRDRLASILSREPYCHSCLTEVPYRAKNGSRGRIDIYLMTNPSWEGHKLFPVVGLELKMARSMGEIVDAIDQVHRYDASLRSAEYRKGGDVLPCPSLFLVGTPDSVYSGAVYPWRHPQIHTWGQDYLIPLWVGVTELYERVLMKHGASVLRKGPWGLGFYSNLGGNHGAIHWHSLESPCGWVDEDGGEDL